MGSFRFTISILLCILFISGCSSVGRESGAPVSKKNALESRDYFRSKSASGIVENEADIPEEAPASVDKKTDVNPSTPPESQRMVIQGARYAIEVENVRLAVQDAEKCVRDLGGFLESSSSSDSFRRAHVVLRVPVKSFFKALETIEKMGTVSFRQIQAQDVTMEFQDTALRMETAEKVRSRLYDLLKRTEKVEEQVKILREIERLTAQIDSMKTRLDYLKSRANLSTITIDFTARVRESASRYMPSPFRWIRDLNPAERSILDNYSPVESATPEGFFFHRDKSSDCLYSTPGNKIRIRLGSVENYPFADDVFWAEALALDIGNRHIGIDPVRKVRNQYGLEFHVLASRPADGSVYVIAFAVSGKSIVVAEVIFSDAKDYAANPDTTGIFLQTVRLR